MGNNSSLDIGLKKSFKRYYSKSILSDKAFKVVNPTTCCFEAAKELLHERVYSQREFILEKEQETQQIIIDTVKKSTENEKTLALCRSVTEMLNNCEDYRENLRYIETISNFTTEKQGFLSILARIKQLSKLYVSSASAPVCAIISHQNAAITLCYNPKAYFSWTVFDPHQRNSSIERGIGFYFFLSESVVCEHFKQLVPETKNTNVSDEDLMSHSYFAALFSKNSQEKITQETVYYTEPSRFATTQETKATTSVPLESYTAALQRIEALETRYRSLELEMTKLRQTTENNKDDVDFVKRKVVDLETNVLKRKEKTELDAIKQKIQRIETDFVRHDDIEKSREDSTYLREKVSNLELEMLTFMRQHTERNKELEFKAHQYGKIRAILSRVQIKKQ